MKLWRLEAIRGLLALYITIGHLFADRSLIFRFGQEAVIVFFLLSGFVIEYSYVRSDDRTFKLYFIKRFSRIYSVFLPMLLLVCLIQRPDLFSVEFIRTFLGNVLMLQDFKEGKPNVLVPTLFASALWSMHYEWWFYMMFFPLRKYIVPISRQGSLICAFSVLAALSYAFSPQAIFRLLMYFVLWWTGVELARSYMANGLVRARDLAVCAGSVSAITMILAANAYLRGVPEGALSLGIYPILEVRHFFAGLLTIVVALLWQAAKWRGFEMLRFGTAIAPISYSLYISHQPLWAEASYLKFIGNRAVEFVLYTIVLVVFCVLSEIVFYRFIARKIREISVVRNA